MYQFPSYVKHYEEDGAIYVVSELHESKVKLTDPSIIAEFMSIVAEKGCAEITTPLTELLHDQALLANEAEISAALTELQEQLNDSLLVTMMPTEGCNFRCPYCYESHEPIMMRRETLEQIFQFLTEQAPKFKHININWFGGEPTLCKDNILETSELMQELQSKHGFEYTANMTTNGYLLKMEDFLLYYHAGITAYQITLDGWNHDKTRPHVSGKGTLQTILDNLVAISALPQEAYQFKIILRYNILPDSDCESWYDHLYNLFGHDERFSVLVRPVGDWGGDTVKSMELIGNNVLEQLMHKHIEYLHKIGMRCENGERHLLSQVCYASYPHSMVFRAGGRIEKCTVCFDHPKNLLGYVDAERGVVLDEEINRIWSRFELKKDCYSCTGVLSCLNLQCRKALVMDGNDHFRCSDVYANLY